MRREWAPVPSSQASILPICEVRPPHSQSNVQDWHPVDSNWRLAKAEPNNRQWKPFNKTETYPIAP
jgi:hypothetical protein